MTTDAHYPGGPLDGAHPGLADNCPDPVCVKRRARPDITVRPTRFEVSLLPEDDINYPVFVVAVEARGRGRWAVIRHRKCLGANGEWSYESIPSEREDEWLDAHRFDLETAKRLAIEAAPGISVNGMTAAQAVARKETP
ncbi:hypothetical protein ABZX65_26930 [Streptomyces sp. NPDC003300]|uniref:hypothetical protein n=1 Tax=unclassified Streptomyces TaxID=2593676 RepID=UPI0033B1D075